MNDATDRVWPEAICTLMALLSAWFRRQAGNRTGILAAVAKIGEGIDCAVGGKGDNRAGRQRPEHADRAHVETYQP